MSETDQQALRWLWPALKPFGPATTWDWPPLTAQSGVNFEASEIELRQISDGASNTYMVGEKYLDANQYETEGKVDIGDNASYYQGFDWDTHRFATIEWLPLPDTPGFSTSGGFGSAHAAVKNMVLCDGSVRSLAFDIDPTTHRRLANRSDGNTIGAF
jgi:hypothetical protein